MDALARQLAKAQHALDAGRADDALAIGRELVRKHPQAVDALLFVGSLYQRAGKASAGLPFLRRAVAAAKDRTPATSAACHSFLAQCLADLGLVDEALQNARAAVMLLDEDDAAFAHTGSLLGNLLCRARAFAEAEGIFRKLVDAPPTDDAGKSRSRAAAHNDLANCLVELGRPNDALLEYRAAIACDPRFADGWANLAAVLCASDRAVEAVEASRRALTIDSRHAGAWLTLGNALSETSHWADARKAYDALLAIEPLSLESRYNRSLACLAIGEWSAWTDYRLRNVVEPSAALVTGLPRWNGETLADKTILVRREQGIGTQIMFSGYLPELANLAAKVLVECDRRMKALWSRTLPGIEFADRTEIFAAQSDGGPAAAVHWIVPRPDVETPIGDLPALLRHADRVSHWPEGIASPRLDCDQELIQKWQARLARLGEGLRVGVSWRGGGTKVSQRKRSTVLEDWHDVFSVAGVSFVSLQYGNCDAELTAHLASGDMTLHRWPDFDPQEDLDDLAALSAALDLVISVDNSTAHLAGAVGARLWLLLPQAADWRWLADGDRSAWYPTADLIRQSSGEWQPLFARVAEKLRRAVAERSHSAAKAG